MTDDIITAQTAEVEALERALDAIHEITRAVIPARDLPSLCRSVFRVLRSVLPFDAGYLEDYNATTDQMITRYAVDLTTEEFPNELWNYRVSKPTNWIVTNRKPLRFGDLHVDVPKRFPDVEFRQFGDTSKVTHSWMSVPLLIGEQMVGIVNIQSYSHHVFTEAHEQMLHMLSVPIAVVWSNMNLITRLEHSIADLRVPMTTLTQDVMIIPLVQGLDEERLNEAIEVILEQVTQQAIENVLFDFSAVPGYDPALVQMISITVRALELSGARTMLIGLHPMLIEGLLHSGVDFAGLRVVRDLPSALRMLHI